MSLDATPDIQVDVGRWRIWAHRPGHERVDVTWVRGVPTQIGDWSWADPFGPKDAALTFPALTMYDSIGSGELFWLAPEVNFDIEWVGDLPAGYPYSRWVWEGYSLPFEYEQDKVSITLVGAMLQLDDCLAKPEYAAQPLPYEVAIARQFRNRADLRLRALEIVWPSWWTETYKPKYQELGQFTPTGVSPGDKWTGLLTRETGSWDKALTSYIQTLLGGMYTRRGRWTLELLPDRRPVLLHREFLHAPDAATVVIQPTQPGVKVNLTEDWSQSANVWYGTSKAITGESYSGLQVIQDGQATVYKPLAALRQVEPVTDRNTWLERHRMRREQVLQAQEGLNSVDLAKVAQHHLQTTADPGLVGTITLESDPRMAGGEVVPRHLIRAGMTLLLPHFKGDPDGVLLHVTEVAYSAEGEQITLTVDSKYRDALTVDEVRNRGRDALNVPRMLITGKVAALLPDTLVPWNYAEGSGYIPSGPATSARRLFQDIDEDIDLTFPYEELTTRRPPRSPSWRTCYIKIGPADLNNASNNWAYDGRRGGPAGGFTTRFAIPIRMSAAGSARQLQVAAYNSDGEVMRVGFHFSIYAQRNTAVASMPKIPAGRVPKGTLFHAGEYYPFFEGAWETYNELGVQTGIEVPQAVKSSGMIRGWGTNRVRAGYWPGSSADGDPPTGLLVDEGVWEWNLIGGQGEAQINPMAYNDLGVAAGYLYCMVYCDRQLDEPVYFMGRIIRVEPGQQS